MILQTAPPLFCAGGVVFGELQGADECRSTASGRWAGEELWRFLFPNDEEKAQALRRVLYELFIYPRYDLADNENLARQEANYRAALPAIAAELDRTDMVALVTVARLLAMVPRERGLLRGRRCGG